MKIVPGLFGFAARFRVKFLTQLKQTEQRFSEVLPRHRLTSPDITAENEGIYQSSNADPWGLEGWVHEAIDRRRIAVTHLARNECGGFIPPCQYPAPWLAATRVRYGTHIASGKHRPMAAFSQTGNSR